MSEVEDATVASTGLEPASEYEYAGVICQRSAEGNAIVEVMRHKEGVEIVESSSFYDIRAPRKLVIPYDEVGEELGYEVTGSDLQVEFATIYGRIINTDDALILFSDFGEAMDFMDNENR